VTTVYLATAGEYSDFRVLHAFANREDAESYKLGGDVLELEVRDGPVEVRYWYDLDWRANWPDEKVISGFRIANPNVDSELRDFDGNERHVQHTWSGPNLNVQGWDKALVRKVYGEQRAQYLARKEGIS
jgi:hypothetical protein